MYVRTYVHTCIKMADSTSSSRALQAASIVNGYRQKQTVLGSCTVRGGGGWGEWKGGEEGDGGSGREGRRGMGGEGRGGSDGQQCLL